MNNERHIWHFSCVGGVNRVNLESGNDLLFLNNLDQKLWTVLSCPVDNLEIDTKTLKLIDTDNDGKIRVPEIIEAVNWITRLIKNPDDLIKRPASLPLDAINTETPEGKTLHTAALRILSNLGITGKSEISLSETSDISAIFANTPFNGDGVITELSTESCELKAVIAQIITLFGSVSDLGGKEGINSELLYLFTANCETYAAWQQKAIDNKSEILPLGEDTEDAYQRYRDLKPKIEDYFLRCQLAEFDPQSTETLNSLSSRIESISNLEINNCLTEISAFPLAKTKAGNPLSLRLDVNPLWQARLLKFSSDISRLLDKNIDNLSYSEWLAVVDKFYAFEKWISEKAGTAVEALGLPAVQNYLASKQKEELLALIDQDKELSEEVTNVLLVDKLVRYYCDIYTLLNNFVTFSDFYSADKKGIFQAGTLYFNQRSCQLCIKVNDLAKHSSIAAGSGICLVYFECTSKARNQKITIVAAFTDGDVDNLEIGRNAIFYDTSGHDWDATIIKVVDNPISIRQAFWSPYRKVSKMISKQFEKIASSQEQKVNAVTTSKIDKVSDKASSGLDQAVKPTDQPTAETTPAATKPTPFDIAKFAGIFAAIGLAFGAIGSALTAIITGFLELSWWQMPLVLIGLMLAISGPSMLLAALKLRKRNLAPVLDANGWAINARATINIKFGATFTHLAKLPKNSKLDLRDPFTQKRKSLLPILILLALVSTLVFLWYYGYLSDWGIF